MRIFFFGMFVFIWYLDIYECCQMIQEEMFPELTYDELEEFILLRIVFWQSGILLRNQMNSRLLLASREVENRNEVFIQWSLREDLSWNVTVKMNIRICTRQWNWRLGWNPGII